MKKQTNAEKRRVTHIREMHSVFDSWDYHLYDKLDDADRIVRRMMREMGQFGVPRDMYVTFLREKLTEILQRIAERPDRSGEY